MINLETVKTLRVLRLPGMARELESQLEDPQRYKGLSFEDRLALLVDAESVSRRQNTIKRRIHDAKLSESTASVEAIEYHEDRKLDKAQLIRFATCNYIEEEHHIILKGATGNGKTYIACALGNAACRKLKTVRYVRMPELLDELTEGAEITPVEAYEDEDSGSEDSDEGFEEPEEAGDEDLVEPDSDNPFGGFLKPRGGKN